METYKYCSRCKTLQPESAFEGFKTCDKCRKSRAKQRAGADRQEESDKRRERYQRAHPGLVTRATAEDMEELWQGVDKRENNRIRRTAVLKQIRILAEGWTAERVDCGLCGREVPRKATFEGLCYWCREGIKYEGIAYIDKGTELAD